MGALFDFFATLLVALATVAFAHFGVAVDDSQRSRDSGEAPRVVKRSPVPASAGETFMTAVRR